MTETKPTSPMTSTRAGEETEDQIKHMVDRFLGWKLPESFKPDAGISFTRQWHMSFGGSNRIPSHPLPMPTGTNLFDAMEADAMVRYMLEGLPDSTASEKVCDHPSTEKAVIGEFSKVLERWREQRDYLRCLKNRGSLTRDWGECSLNNACRIVEDLTTAIAAASLIANPANSLRGQPDPSLLGRETVREETIEECAKVCEGLRRKDYSAENEDWAAGTSDCAKAIRALSPLKE